MTLKHYQAMKRNRSKTHLAIHLEYYNLTPGNQASMMVTAVNSKIVRLISEA